MFAKRTRGLSGLAAGLILMSLSGPARGADRSRVLILTSDANPGWRETTPVLRYILDETGRFDTRVCEAPVTLSARILDGFDLVLDNGAGLEPGGDAEKAIAAFIASGKGLLVTQGGLLAATEAPDFWPAFAKRGPPPPVQFLSLSLDRGEHPVVAGLNSPIRIADSVPRGVTVRPGAEVIATTAAPRESVDPTREPALVAWRHGKGRAVCVALGQSPSTMHEPAFVATFARASEWAATGNVTLPANLDPAARDQGAVKALVITGGHDHETAFYSLFDGRKDLDWLPVDSSANAFQKDIRGKYDVLVMYDFTRDMDEPRKKNLRDFVESGKGVVVLHHALLNFQTWTWWSEDVVGGRYRLQREGPNPSSSVKNDQQIFVTPALAHPVVAGLSPFHLQDESYKNLFMSERIRPLLTTDNPTSDQNLAWIGPCATSRVVAIQLGHGHSAFAHPSYRALVHNAVLWAAGKTK